MAKVEQYQAISIDAGSDLSSDQFKFVLTAADGEVDVVSSAGGQADGVLMNAPSAQGRPATVAYAGRVKVIAGGAITAGDLVQSDASGEAINGVTTGDFPLGRALTSAADGELVEILLNISNTVV